MKDAVVVMDMPSCCFECPFRYQSDKWNRGDYTYTLLFSCKLQPESVENPYLQNIMREKPDWCPLKELPQIDKGNYFPDEYQDGWNACIREICSENRVFLDN